MPTPRTQSIIDESKDLMVNTYNTQSVVIDHAKGMYCYDLEGNAYLDFAGGIAVASLGHGHPKVLDTLTKQSARLMTCHNTYITEVKYKAAKMLVDASCFDQVFFCNSGTEGIEAALKCARKWAYDTKGPGCSKIISFSKSYHGRTYGAASVTAKSLSQPFFAPHVTDIDFAAFNDIKSVKSLINDKTAAVIIEPIQGASGVIPADPAFIKELRELCDAHKVCLIFDEVQTGLGRIGSLFAYQSYGIEPDIAVWAKGIGAGIPAGVMAVKKAFGAALTPGTHGTTFGGNPLACAMIVCAFEEISKDAFLKNVKHVSGVLFEGLNRIAKDTGKVTDIRGAGLMIGIDTTLDAKTLFCRLQENGLMVTLAGEKTVRLLPPLILGEDDARKGLEIIEKTLREM